MATNIELVRGDYQELRIATETYDPVTATWSAMNLTGATIWLTAKRKISDADAAAVFQIKTPTDIVVSDPLTGVCVAKLQPANTSALPDIRTRLHYDVQVVIAGKPRTPLVEGWFTVIPDITRDTA